MNIGWLGWFDGFVALGVVDPCPYKASIESLLNFSELTSGCFWLKKLSSSAFTLEGETLLVLEDVLTLLLLGIVVAAGVGAARNSPKGSVLSSPFVPFAVGTSEI